MSLKKMFEISRSQLSPLSLSLSIADIYCNVYVILRCQLSRAPMKPYARRCISSCLSKKLKLSRRA